MKTTKRSASILLAIMFLLSMISLPANANSVESSESITGTFVANASMDVNTLEDGLTEISMTNFEEIPNNSRSTLDTRQYNTTSLTFLAESPDEKNEILSRINQVKASGGTIYDEDWFFGSSCYAYVSITYTTRDVEFATEAKINSVTTKFSTNSGTTIANAVLHLECVGSSYEEGSTILEKDIEVIHTPYTTTLMNSWPWIYTTSPSLGASFTVTAKRPSGESSTHTVCVNVFIN